ncbi:MAG: GntR family transcriptional regulator [Parvibaculaceae bacterium]
MDTASVIRDFAADRPTPKTAFQFALETIRGAIASGAVKEGEPLLQNDIAAALGLSRMPVREALRMLEAAGWVEFLPYKGAVVARLSVEEIIETFDIRFALESLALRKSLPAMPDDALARADALISALDRERDVGRWVDLNRQFHLCLYTGAGKRLLGAIGEQYDAADRYLRIELETLHNAEESQSEHRALLAACRLGDIDAALTVFEPHVAEAGRDLAAALTRRRGVKS